MQQINIRSITNVQNKPLHFYLIPLTIWLVAIFALSAQPHFTTSQPWMLFGPIRKSAHIIEFALLTGLVWLIVQHAKVHFSWFKALAPYQYWITFFLPLIYAITDEIHQSFVPPRQAQITDVMFDTVGICLALWLIWRRQQRE